MEERIRELRERLQAVEEELLRPETSGDRNLLESLGRQHTTLRRIVEAASELERLRGELAESDALLADPDPELVELAREERSELEVQERALQERLLGLLLPQAADDDRDAVLEIRGGTGGDEAALFAGDLFRMYARHAERKGWKLEIIDSHPGSQGGFKEITALIHGSGVFGRLRFESGVHRVQRVPRTEAQGRIHTSAATVAVLPQVERAEVEIDPGDLKIDLYRSSGAGGQHVNKTESAVRITHLPTGVVVTCQDEKSQHKNRERALQVLRARLRALEQERLDQERSQARRAQVGSGDRSGKIRTYNFPQSRVTDHRIGFTSHRLEGILDGELDEFIDALAAEERVRLLSGGEDG